MKNIKQLKDLKEEQKRLRERQDELAFVIREDIAELKEDLHPRNLAGKAISGWIDKKIQSSLNGEDVLGGTLSYAAILLTRKLVKKARKRMEKYFK